MKNKIIIFITIGVILIFGIIFSKLYPFEEFKIDEANEQDEKVTITGTRPVAPYYCKTLGYEWKVITKASGDQYGICIFPDGSECSDWAFYAGTCGQKWTYCKQKGYDLKIKDDGKDPFSPRAYSVCVDKNTGEEIGSVFGLMNMSEALGFGRALPKSDLQYEIEKMGVGEIKEQIGKY